MFSTEAERIKQWETAEKTLQQIHDKDWQIIRNSETGKIEALLLQQMFYEYLVSSNWRGYLTIIKREKREHNWQQELLVRTTNVDIKRYRRDMENPITMAKDIARTIRKAEKAGRGNVDFIAMYSTNQQAQLIAAELYTHVTKEGLTIAKGYDGLLAVLFGSMHLMYRLTEGKSEVQITMRSVVSNKKTVDGLNNSASTLQDIAELTEKGYTLNSYSTESGEHGSSNKIVCTTDQDIANFTRIYGDLKTTSVGRAIIQKFMESKMAKK